MNALPHLPHQGSAEVRQGVAPPLPHHTSLWVWVWGVAVERHGSEVWQAAAGCKAQKAKGYGRRGSRNLDAAIIKDRSRQPHE